MKKIYKKTTLIIIFIFVSSYTCFGQWISNGPYGGEVKEITTNTSNNDIYAVLGSSQNVKTIVKSMDSGTSWINLTNETTPNDIRAIKVLDNSLYIGTGSGVYRSDDDGNTWVQKLSGWVNHLTVNGTTIFAAGSTLKRTLDFGETWTNSENGLNGNYLYSLETNNGIVYAGTGDNYEGIFRSLDNGISWQNVSNGMAFYYEGDWYPEYKPVIRSIGFKANEIYVGTSLYQGIWKSDDNGDNWVHLGSETMNYDEILSITSDNLNVYAGTSTSGVLKYDGVILTENNTGVSNFRSVNALEHLDNAIFSGNASGIYKSTNNTTTWVSSNNGILAHSPAYKPFAKIGDDLFVGTFSGVYKTSDGGITWEDKSAGLPFSQWLLSEFNTNGNALFAWDRVSVDSGNSWVMSETLSPSATTTGNGPRWLVHNNQWFTKSSNEVFMSNDNGNSWVPMNNGLPSNMGIHNINSTGSFLLIGTSIGNFTSVDNGNNWIAGNTNGFNNFNQWTLLYAKVVETNSSLIYGLAGGGGSFGVYTSVDDGVNWVQTLSDLSVEKLIENNGVVYVSGNRNEIINGQPVIVPRVFSSLDNGQTWNLISQFSTGIVAYSLIVENSNIYISDSNFNIFRSADNGNSWVNISQGMFNNSNSNLYISDNKIFTAVAGNSIWQRSLDDFLPPNQPAEIFGATTICENSSQTYSIDEVVGSPGFDITYNWQVPNDWTILSGQGTISINVTVGTNSGIISVTASNDFGISQPQTLNVIVDGSAPDQPSMINGEALPCINATEMYSVTNVVGVNYSWSIPSDWNLVSGNGSNAIEVIVGESSGIIDVIPSNACDSGLSQTTTVTPKDSPAQPGNITGPENPESNSIQFYSVENTPGVTYTWAIPIDWILMNGQGTNIIGVTVGTDSGNITCTPSNNCGTGLSSILNVTVEILGISDSTNNNEIKVYPNPSNGKINIAFNNLIGYTNMEVRNILGSKSMNYNFELTSNNSINEFDLTSLPAGMYIIHVNNDNKSFFKKIVIK